MEEVATVLELEDFYQQCILFNQSKRENSSEQSFNKHLSKAAAETTLLYTTSIAHTQIHKNISVIISKDKLWNRDEPDDCRVNSLYDFVMFALTNIVVVVDKEHKIRRDNNIIKGGVIYRIRTYNKLKNKPFGLYKLTTASSDELLIDLTSNSREEYLSNASKLEKWYNSNITDSIYPHCGLFRVLIGDIDAFISYVNSQID